MPQLSSGPSNGSDITKAVALLKQTLPEMNKRNIATTPENYAVWYEYVSGENSELVAAIQALDNSKSTYTNELHRDLYNRFIASAREAAVNKLSESVREEEKVRSESTSVVALPCGKSVRGHRRHSPSAQSSSGERRG